MRITIVVITVIAILVWYVLSVRKSAQQIREGGAQLRHAMRTLMTENDEEEEVKRAF